MSCDLTLNLLEYSKAISGLGDTSSDEVQSQYSACASPFQEMFSGVTRDFPMVSIQPEHEMTVNINLNVDQIYFITKALFSPTSLSVASIGTLQNTATSLRDAIERLEAQSKSIPTRLDNVISIYNALDVDPAACVMKGEQYPPSGSKSNGMQIEARQVVVCLSSLHSANIWVQSSILLVPWK